MVNRRVEGRGCLRDWPQGPCCRASSYREMRGFSVFGRGKVPIVGVAALASGSCGEGHVAGQMDGFAVRWFDGIAFLEDWDCRSACSWAMGKGWKCPCSLVTTGSIQRSWRPISSRNSLSGD